MNLIDEIGDLLSEHGLDLNDVAILVNGDTIEKEDFVEKILAK